MAFFNVPGISSDTSRWSFVWFDNFVEIFGRTLFIDSYKNILVIMFAGGIGVLFFAVLFAWVMKKGMPLSRVWKNIIYLPTVITPVAMVVLWTQYVFNSRFGLFKSVFSFLHLDGLAAIPWTSPKYLFVSMLIAYCFGSVGYYMLLMMAAMSKIPDELYEAAYIDGAKEGHVFLRITLPLIRANIKTIIQFWCLGCVTFFLWSRVFTVNSDPATMTPANYMYTLIFGETSAGYNAVEPNVGLGAAVGVSLCVAVVAIFALLDLAFGSENYEF